MRLKTTRVYIVTLLVIVGWTMLYTVTMAQSKPAVAAQPDAVRKRKAPLKRAVETKAPVKKAPAKRVTRSRPKQAAKDDAQPKTPKPGKPTQPQPARGTDSETRAEEDKLKEAARSASAADLALEAKQKQDKERFIKGMIEAKAARQTATASEAERLKQLRAAAEKAKPKPSVEGKALLRNAKKSTTREFRVKDVSGKHNFEVRLTASGWVEKGVLDYLQSHLEIAPYRATPGRDDESKAWHTNGQLDQRADEIAVTLKALDSGVNVQQFAWTWPSGFELVRPGVLHIRPEFRDAFKGRTVRMSKTPPARTAPRALIKRAEKRGKAKLTSLKLKVMCRAKNNGIDMTPVPVPFVKVKSAGKSGYTDANGEVKLSGDWDEAATSFEIEYKGDVKTHGVSSGLRIMAELHDDIHSENKTAQPSGSSGSELVMKDLVLTSVDCETWRLGEEALSRYHELVKKSPPAGRLRIKRWSVDWGGTPYTFYDHIVLTKDWTKKDRYKSSSERSKTIHHEFGHSIRHVADGDINHWNWDNFRWAYARSHSGCEVFNTQYAFNEGWAGYWENWARNRSPDGCKDGPDAKEHAPEVSSNAAKFVDWVEDMINKRLYDLSQELKTNVCSGADTEACAAQKMVQVLEENPGKIHSLWEFEKSYCKLHHAGNTMCTSSGVPKRAKPKSCPPGFTDDGATCRLHKVVAKPSYGRGVGVVPTGCDSKQEYDAGLCYAKCRNGYNGVGPVCWQRCPNRFRDDGAFCAKPEAYGRGAGYPWKIGDKPFSLKDARKRCEKKHGKGNCETHGAIVYPKCRSGFHNVGCCICSPNCIDGMNDIGVSCAKKSYGRGVGKVPTKCQGGKEYDAGLCYKHCRSGYNGVGPVCWGKCQEGFTDQGALCSRPAVAKILVKY